MGQETVAAVAAAAAAAVAEAAATGEQTTFEKLEWDWDSNETLRKVLHLKMEYICTN